MSVCRWSDGDLYVYGTDGDAFVTHVSGRRGLAFDNQSYTMTARETLDNMKALQALGYNVPDWAIDTMVDIVEENVI